MKKFILFDHDGVLVDTEYWYFKAGQIALRKIGIEINKDQYLKDMTLGLGTWSKARAAGLNDQAINQLRSDRNTYYQHYLQTKDISIKGVEEALTELSNHFMMAIVTTSKHSDFSLIKKNRKIIEHVL